MSLPHSVFALWPPHSWESKCINALNDSTFQLSNGLVNGNGEPMTSFNDSTWGIDLPTCHQYCNPSTIPFPVFYFQTFASCLTNYLLPFLTLTAQLPFETGSPWSNIMSFFLAVGSPALATYSLTITIMNRAWVRSLFKGLRSKIRRTGTRSGLGGYESRIKAAQFLLQESQQVPLRASQQGGWLSSLIVLPNNCNWWEQLYGRLRSTRRGITQSLVAQTLFAAIAYAFTVIASFDTDLGDPNTALQIASGSLWIWLIPVIWGWVIVGTQYRANSIKDALEADEADRALVSTINPDTNERTQWTERTIQQGLIVRPGLNPLPHEDLSGNLGLDVPNIDHLEVRGWYGAAVGGDEQRRGPIYNYSRVFTFWQLSMSMKIAMSNTLDGIAKAKRVTNLADQSFEEWNSDHNDENKTLCSDTEGVAKSCGLFTNHLLAYPRWNEIGPDVRTRILVGSFAALFVQWGTTGASILIAYQTPTRGLSCRSGSYLLYGVMGTIVWFYLLISMLLSHEVMLRYQKVQVDNPSIDFRNPNEYRRRFGHAFFCAAAVCLRRFGKFLAGVNALWLIISSLLEFTGVYDNCWCSGVFVGLGDQGWVSLFKNKEDLRNRALGSWIGGFAITAIVCAVSCICFYLGCLEDDDE